MEHSFGGSELILLLVMAYDCYATLCKPLHYLVIMRQGVCVVLLLVPWVGRCLHSVTQLITIYGLPFCGPNVIDHFTRDVFPLLKLVCTDTYVIGILVVANGGLMCIIVFLFLSVSYGVILHSPKNLSQEGGGKPSKPVVPTSLWLSVSLFPVFSCMQDLLRPSPLTNR